MHAQTDRNGISNAFRERPAFFARTLLSPRPAVDASTATRYQTPARRWCPMRGETRLVYARSGQALNRVSGRIKQGQSPRTIRTEGQTGTGDTVGSEQRDPRPPIGGNIQTDPASARIAQP